MKLLYHEGANFGDALNPMILNALLPDFFDDNSEETFLGIGSILGLKRPGEDVKKMIVFSSGFGAGDDSTYGSIPSEDILKKYDFRCVRGPLTAKILKLNNNLSVCDGAILLSEVIEEYKGKKEYKFSYIPHLGSLKYYSKWKELLDDLDINLIDPTRDIDFVINEIQKSEVILAEAMHGAIVADTLRVPWIPVKTNKTINEFKWNDFCQSVEINYNPNRIKTLFDKNFMQGIVENKFAQKGLKIKLLNKFVTSIYMLYQKTIIKKKVIQDFKNLKNKEAILSNSELLQSKKDRLLSILKEIAKDYAKA